MFMRAAKKANVRREPTKAELGLRGLVSAVVAIAVLGLVFGASRGLFGGPDTVSAEVANAGGSLRTGGDVKVNGVLVGKVTKISAAKNGKVRLDIAMSDGELGEIPRNVHARILPATVFGTTYVDLVPQGPHTKKRLEAGAVIPEDTSVGTVELQSALDDIDGITKALGPAQLASALSSTSRALDGKGVEIGQMIDELDGLLRTIQPSTPLIRSDIHKLAINLELVQRTAPDMLKAIDDSLSTVRTVTTEKATISTIIAGGTTLVDHADRMLRNNRTNLVTYLRNAATVLDAFYDNRDAAFNKAMSTNREATAKVHSVIKHGWVDTTAPIQPSAPPYYGAGDCPRYGSARGDNCGGSSRLANASASRMLGGGGQ